MSQDTLSLNKQSSSGETVTVACKLPHGLILRVFNKVERDELVMGGGSRKTTVYEQREEVFAVNGWSHPQNAAPHCQLVGGYALTHDIPKGHWDLWLSQNKNSMMVKNGMIFAHEKTAMAQGEAKEKKNLKSGFERIDPNNLPKSVNTSDMRKAA